MIQEIAPHKLNNQYEPRKVENGDFIIYSESGCVLVYKEENSFRLPVISEKNGSFVNSWNENIDTEALIYLFKVDDKAYFWDRNTRIEVDKTPDGTEYVHMQMLSRMEPKWQGFAGASAVHLINWYRSMKYCGICGGERIHDSKERMMYCPHCKDMQFPKICPVVIVGVIKGDKILLTKYADRGRFARFALIAGFAEFAESIEETVYREVKEETNLDVKNLHFYRSQPWAFSSSLLMGFFCELDGEDHIAFNDNELSTAVWMPPEEMPEDTDHISLTAEMMQQFRKYGRDVLIR